MQRLRYKILQKYAPKKKAYCNLLGSEVFNLYAYQVKYICELGNWNGFIVYRRNDSTINF